MEYVGVFLLWTFVIYWSHRIFHMIPALEKIHWCHHKYVLKGTGSTGWEWKHLFMWVDNLDGTIDQWLMEVIPTILLSWITGHWWLCLFYWINTAFVQEHIRHNKRFDVYPLLTSGKWHMVHHKHKNNNYGVFFPIWDILFGTAKRHS